MKYVHIIIKNVYFSFHVYDVDKICNFFQTMENRYTIISKDLNLETLNLNKYLEIYFTNYYDNFRIWMC